MRFLVYAMIGLGFANASPYASLSIVERAALLAYWPAVLTRDLINEAARRNAAAEARPAN